MSEFQSWIASLLLLYWLPSQFAHQISNVCIFLFCTAGFSMIPFRSGFSSEWEGGQGFTRKSPCRDVMVMSPAFAAYLQWTAHICFGPPVMTPIRQGMVIVPDVTWNIGEFLLVDPHSQLLPLSSLFLIVPRNISMTHTAYRVAGSGPSRWVTPLWRAEPLGPAVASEQVQFHPLSS